MLKDGQKDIITIKSNGNKQTYHIIAASICSSKSNSGSRCGVQFPGIISRQLCTVSCAGTDYIILPTTPGRTKSTHDQENSR